MQEGVSVSSPRDGRKVKVGLVQINNSFSGQHYLPLSVGMLQAYAQQHLRQPDNYEFLLPIHSRIPVEMAVQKLLDAHIVFFSTYVWNVRISLEVAKTLKLRKPETLIVFGGPQVPDRVEGFLRKHSFIDIACHGEGEQVASTILENSFNRNWEEIPSVSFLKEDGSLVQNPKAPRMKDLSVISSPYLAGVFGPLIKANPQEHWIALWETNRGCPFSCTFCDWGSAIQSKVYVFDIERIYGETEWFAAHKIEFVFCCDANFGILPRDVDIAAYVAETKTKYGYPQALSVQNTKNATERAYKTQKILADAGLNKGVDIALQSMDPNTLESIKRGNISTETYQELQRRFTKEHVETYTDLILGLPGETYESFVNAVATIIENGQHNRIQFNNLSILPNAEMGDPEYQRKYGMETVVSKVVNIHGSLDEEDEVYEEQELVIATNSMPRDQWVRTRAFCWMTAFLYFDKVFQIPLTMLRECCGVGYRELLELFSEGDLKEYPVLAEARSFFLKKARNIQNGGPEYVQSKEWLNIWWPADEYILIKFVVEDRLDAFYQEAETLLARFLHNPLLELPPVLLHESILLNRSLIKKPFQTEDIDLELSYNIWEFYRSVLRGQPIPLESRPTKCHIDRTSQTWSTWDVWFREVIWWGNKKGAYLYGTRSSTTEFAGHF
jgi:radical SAM superfamily enzyme YgiQ (UPF0313 family)